MNKSLKVKTKSGIITLTDKDYKASGGQGVVYCQDKTAYKIYHDPSTMIPVAKIQELSTLRNKNILGPTEPLYNPKNMTPIGFAMSYVDATEFLCKVFTRNFRDEKGLSPKDMVDMVTEMQKTLQYIHSMKFLVVDYNEMNFLLGPDLKVVYYIDVDSWKTPSFPAVALMESVRDRKSPKGVFTELTDWFSFAVVTFQMYTGIHPYKGFHTKFAPSEWSRRMDLGISVFDKDVSLPRSCQDFSIIPKKHLDWYKEIFIKGDRSIPPYADSVQVSIQATRRTSGQGLVVELIKEYQSIIQKLYFFDGKRYAITSDGLYREDELVFQSQKLRGFEMSEIFGEDPIICHMNKGVASFFDLNKKLLGEIQAEALFGANNLVYTVCNGDLIENSFERMGKLVHRTRVVSSICPSFRVFPGVVVQDDFMRCHLAIPYEKGLCANIHVKELDGYRIIDAKHEGLVTVLMAEKHGDYFKYVLSYDDDLSKYGIWSEKVDSLHAINFVALPNKLNLMVDDEKAVLFKDSDRKEMKNSIIEASTRLYHDGMTVFFTDGEKLYQVRTQ